MSIDYTTQVFTFGLASGGSPNEWVSPAWNASSGPLTIEFTTATPVNSIWVPTITSPISYYAGTTATGTPFYVSLAGAGAELVPIPNGTLAVTMSAASGTMQVFASSLPFGPELYGVIGAQVTSVTATAPITSSGGSTPNIALTNPLALIYGGTGTASPVGVRNVDGSITVSGSFPDQVISISSGAGGVQSVSATAPLSSTGGQNPVISIANPLPIVNGGTGESNPTGVSAGAGITVTGSFPDQTVTNNGVTELDGQKGNVTTNGTGGIVTSATGGVVTIDGSALVETINNSDGTVTVHRSGQTVTLSAANAFPCYLPNGTSPTGIPHCVFNDTPISITFSSNTLSSTAISFVGNAQFTNANTYSVVFAVQAVTGSGPPVFVLEAVSQTASGFTIAGYGTGGTGSGSITFNFIAIGT